VQLCTSKKLLIRRIEKAIKDVDLSDLTDYEKFIFCKHFSEPSFRHGWLLSFRRAIISDEEYHALETLAEKHFIELRDEGNGFIAIGRPIWPELYHKELPGDA
jgi:hypothetical protein